MELKWMKQPEGSNLCGQIAVTVLANIPLDDAIKLVGKKGCTTTKRIAKALRKVGFQCTDRLCRKPRPELGLGKLTYPKKQKGHWVVIQGDKIYDGIYGKPDGTVYWKPGWKLTSYLPLTKNNLCSTETDNFSITVVGG
jgi:hypothetical protein